MKIQKKQGILVTLLLSLTLISVQVGQLFPETIRDRLEKGERANILLIGIDARPGEVNARSDTIILLSVNRKSSQAVVVSIPRDTRVVVQGKHTKINMINQLKGPEALCEEVGQILAEPVEYYILTNFQGFEESIDLIGGVYMDVDIEIQSPSSGIYLHKGYQKLSGKEALKYVRFRGGQDADIGRTQRQQRLLQALAVQMRKKENLTRLPALIPQLRENVHTNLGWSDLLYLAGMAGEFDSSHIVTQTLPGYHYFSPYSGASFWEADREIARSLLDSLYQGHQFKVQLEKPPWAQSR